MKWRPDGFRSDVLTLSLRDLVCLLLGIECCDGACIVTTAWARMRYDVEPRRARLERERKGE